MMDHRSNPQADTVRLLGRYANYFVVGYNVSEIVIDFGQFYNGAEEACVHTRIITSPAYAQVLLETLKESLDQRHESFECSEGG
jgi:hypothetical protein